MFYFSEVFITFLGSMSMLSYLDNIYITLQAFYMACSKNKEQIGFEHSTSVVLAPKQSFILGNDFVSDYFHGFTRILCECLDQVQDFDSFQLRVYVNLISMQMIAFRETNWMLK